MSQPLHHPAFDAWYNEIEGFALRAERTGEDLGPPERYLPWLKAAFDAGLAVHTTYQTAPVESLGSRMIKGLQEAILQLEYMESRWPTGTTPNVLGQLKSLVEEAQQL